MNMEVADTSRKPDVCFSTADSTERDNNASSSINDRSRPTADDEDDENPVDARLTDDKFRTGNNGIDAGTRKREEIPDSSEAASNDCQIVDSDGNANGHHVPQSPLAFTIDFGSSKEVDTARYQNLFERYNARHRRNLSTSKVSIIPSAFSFIFFFFFF